MPTNRDSAMRVVVLGYVVRGPIGGMVASNLQYLQGLMRLGHDVWFVEDSDDYASCYQPDTGEVTADPTAGLAFAAAAFDRIGLGCRWAYHDAHTGRWLGPGADGAEAACRGADLVLNLCGVNPLRDWLMPPASRVLVDEDPVFTQVRHLQDPAARERAARHTAFFSFGEAFGRDGCGTPDDGFAWQPTRQPIVLDTWPEVPPRPDAAFTTVMQWGSYRCVEHAGIRYGMKRESFDPYLDLPRRVGATLAPAVGSIGGDDRRRLADHGWAVQDPAEPSRDPWSYRRFIQGSKAEFAIQKHAYVAARTGWFSERTACYLASGRPAVVQDTGFGPFIPAGDGLHAFDSPAAAAAAIDRVCSGYKAQCRAARELAEAHFDATAVLTSLLERAHRPPTPA